MALNNSSKIDYLQSFTIANGATDSDVLDLKGDAITALLVDDFTGTKVAVHSCDTEGGTFMPVYDADGDAVEILISAPGYNLADPIKMLPLRFVKLVSDASEAAARTIKVAAQPI